jgi:hypothetical protein
MKDGNWIAIDKNVRVWLPRNRKYTELEALVSYSIDINENNAGTIFGYSQLWLWSRNKVRKFIKDLNSGGFSMDSRKDSKWTVKNQYIHLLTEEHGQQKDTQKDTTINNNKNIRKKHIAKKTSSKGKDNGKANAVIAKFCTLYKNKYGVAYTISGKDAGIAKRVCKHLDVSDLLDLYFQSTDKFIIDGCHAFNIFESQINKLRANDMKEKTQTPEDKWGQWR